MAAEYWLLMLVLPSLAKLSPSSSSSELLREALWRTSTPGALCSRREGREVPMAPSEASLARTSWPDPLTAIPESWSDSWMASSMLGSSSSREPRPCETTEKTVSVVQDEQTLSRTKRPAVQVQTVRATCIGVESKSSSRIQLQM